MKKLFLQIFGWPLFRDCDTFWCRAGLSGAGRGASSSFRILLIALLALLFPQSAHANAGTPLMWLGALHLTAGNAIIGCIEGLLIAIVFRVKKRRALPIMILANYISMAIGSVGISYFQKLVGQEITLYSIHSVLGLLVFGAVVISVLIEWPFCFWILKKAERMKDKSFRASLMAQVLSYAIIIPLYLSASGISLLTTSKMDKSLSFVKTDPWVYYISTKNDAIYRIRAHGGTAEKIVEASVQSDYARLFVRPSSSSGKWDLWLKDRAKDEKNSETLLLKEFEAHTEPLRRSDGKLFDEEPDTRFNFGTQDFRPASEKDWEVRTDFWTIEGLTAKNKKTGEKLYVALETPFVQWRIRNVAVLPNDQTVFQLGEKQIVAMDLHSKQIGIIANGRGPLVAFD